MMRFDLFNAFLPLQINDIRIVDSRNRLINVTVLTDEPAASPAALDGLLKRNNPGLHRAYLFTYRVLRQPQGRLDTSQGPNQCRALKQ